MRLDTVRADVGPAGDIACEPLVCQHIAPVALAIVGCWGGHGGAAAPEPYRRDRQSS